MEPIVHNTEWIKYRQQVIPDKHLEHCRGEVEVDRCSTLRTCTREIEDEPSVFLLHFASDRVRPNSLTIVVHKICEGAWLVTNLRVNQFRNTRAVSSKELVARSSIDTGIC